MVFSTTYVCSWNGLRGAPTGATKPGKKESPHATTSCHPRYLEIKARIGRSSQFSRQSADCPVPAACSYALPAFRYLSHFSLDLFQLVRLEWPGTCGRFRRVAEFQSYPQ